MIGTTPEPLADDFFRLAHHDVTGRARLHPRPLAFGVAAALLGELLVAQRVTVGAGRLHVLDRRPPADALVHTVLDQLAAESGHLEIRQWLDFLAHDAVERVARRLWRAGRVRPEQGRRLMGRSPVTYVPTDINVAGWPWARLSNSLRQDRPISRTDGFLVGLVAATNFDRDLLAGAPGSAHNYLRHVTASVHPALAELLVHTEAAVGDAVLAYRR